MVITAGEADEDYHHRRETNHPLIMDSSVGPENSRETLPNFTSLPCFNVQWGRQKHLRCVKHSDNDHHEFSTSLTRSEFNSDDHHHNRKRRRSTEDTHDGGIQAVREKLMIDFRRQVDLIQADFLKKSDVVSTVAHSPKVTAAAEARPWNLRTRRAICKDPNNVPLSSDRKPCISPARLTEIKSPMKRNGEVDGGGVGDGEDGNGPRAKFSASISKQEIEEDFLAIMGTRPARRPKKRPKNVQRLIDAIFPGFWLSEITVDMYKVNEYP